MTPPATTNAVPRRVPIRLLACAGLLGLALAAIPLRGEMRTAVRAAAGHGTTVAQRLEQYGPAARARLRPTFRAAGVAYPPARVTLLADKSQRVVHLYAAARGPWRYVRAYPMRAASGTLGPKLCEGDGQVPEGRYRVESLNPNSAYHLSLRLNYPNAFDRAMGRADGRRQLGGDIMIHGRNVSIGCLAMGDPAAEELFVLAADTGVARMTVLITPVDFRVAHVPTAVRRRLPAWTTRLYADLGRAMAALPPVPTRRNRP